MQERDRAGMRECHPVSSLGPPIDFAVFNMFTYSARRQVRITNAAIRNWLALLRHHPFPCMSLQQHLRTQNGAYAFVIFTSFKKKRKKEMKQTRVLFQKKKNSIADYLLIFCSFSFKCKTGGRWLLLEESKAPCLQLCLWN